MEELVEKIDAVEEVVGKEAVACGIWGRSCVTWVRLGLTLSST